jgi:hypothetical protein
MRNGQHRCWIYGAVALSVAAWVASAGEQPKAPEPPRAARQQLKPERLVSETSFLYVTTPDLRKARAAFERSAFRGVLGEEEVSGPLTAALGKLREAYVRGDGTRSEADMRRRSNEADLLARVMPLLDGQVALAMDGDLTGVISGGTLPRFLLVVGLPPGEEGENRQRELAAIMEKHRALQCMDPRYRDFEERVGAYDLVRIENGDLAAFEAWGFVENLFLYGQGKRVLEEAVERFAVKNGQGTLALHQGYQDAYREVGQDQRTDALVYLQADVRPMLKPLAATWSVAEAMLQRVHEAPQPQFALGMYIGDGEQAAIREKIVARLNKGALSRGGARCDGVSARFAANETLFFQAVQTSGVELYKALAGKKKAADEKPAEKAEDKAAEKTEAVKSRDWASSLSQALKAANEDELLAKLAVFKGEAAVFMSYVPQPNLKVEAPADLLAALQPVFALELDRENAQADKQVETMLADVRAAIKREFLEITSGGAKVYYQQGADPREAPKGGGVGLFHTSAQPGAEDKLAFFAAYARMDVEAEPGKTRKFLLLSDSLDALRTAVLQAQAKYAHSSLADNKDYKERTKAFREARTLISYVDLRQAVNLYGDLLPSLASKEVQGDEMQLPSPTALRAHVFAMAWAATIVEDPEQLVVECASPFGNLPLLGVATAVTWPTIVHRQRQAVSEEMDEKFRRLTLALNLYAADFSRFPPQLSDLHPNYLKGDMELKVFESPFKRGAVKTPQDADNPEATNLVYMPGRSLYDLGTDILVYEKEPTKLASTRDNRLYHHVLFVDPTLAMTRRGWLTKRQLDRLLAGKAELPTEATAEATTGPATSKGPAPKTPPKTPPKAPAPRTR